jgi:NDP-sugar pyrophosphorylase family protein
MRLQPALKPRAAAAEETSMSNRAVILAGGKATRLGSYTTVLPKPLLPVGGRPVLEIVLQQLHAAGFDRITLAVGYLSHLVRAVVDGSEEGTSVDYHEEDSPLGTIGPLASIAELDEPFLLMNGDVLTTLDYADLLATHVRAGNALTIATHRRVVRTEYGVLHVANGNGHKKDGEGNGNGHANGHGNGNGHANGNSHRTQAINGFEEKPELAYSVSMGVYALHPRALEHVPGGRFDLPDLVLRLVQAGEQVGSYGFDGSWYDLGRHDDYVQATAEFELVPDMLPR